METQDVATKVTKVLLRPDGSQVRIVAEIMFGAGLHPSTDVTVFKRDNESQPWKLCNDRPAEGWKQMPLSEYISRGRSEVLRTVSHGEIFAVAALLGKPMSEFARSAQA
jgi:hypothetical protein